MDAKAAQAQADRKGGGGDAPKGRKGVTMSRPEGKVALLTAQGEKKRKRESIFNISVHVFG